MRSKKNVKKQIKSQSDRLMAKLRAEKILQYSRQNKQIKKRDRLVQRIAAKAGQGRMRKPKRKDRAEIVARQKKGRAPYGLEE